MAAKGCLIGLMMLNVREFPGQGVTVNCIYPGHIQMDMAETLLDMMKDVVINKYPSGTHGTAGGCHLDDKISGN